MEIATFNSEQSENINTNLHLKNTVFISILKKVKKVKVIYTYKVKIINIYV